MIFPEMGRVHRDLRLKLFGKFESGLTAAQIIEETKLPKATVYRYKSKFEKGESVDDKSKTGRPRKTNSKQDHRLYHLAIRYRKITSSQLNCIWSSKCPVNVSSRTVRNRLKAKGLRGCIAKRKPLISKINRVKRLDWAKQFAGWTDDQWSNVVWSDESTFQLIQSSRRSIVWRKPGEEYNDDCISKTVKFGGGSITVWGCITTQGVGVLRLCEGTVNSEEYINILASSLAPSGRALTGCTE